MALITLCNHCSTEIKSGKYCKNCATAEGRRLMDEENRKYFKENGLEFHCKHCEKNVGKSK